MGCCYVVFKEVNLLFKIKRFAGSSAGALAATLLAIQCDSITFKEYVSETDFKQFQDYNEFLFMDYAIYQWEGV